MDSSTSAPPTTKERKSTANGASSCGTEMQENERISGLLLQKFDNIAESSIKRALDSLRKATSAADKQEYNQRIRTFASCVANRKLLLNLLWDETAQMGGDVILHNVIDQSELNVRKIIGSGGFGKVVQAKWRGEEIAVKFIDQNSPDFYYENFKAECTILTLLQHPCIVPMYGAGSYKTPENKNGPPSSGFFLAMMLMTGNLRDQVSNLLSCLFRPLSHSHNKRFYDSTIRRLNRQTFLLFCLSRWIRLKVWTYQHVHFYTAQKMLCKNLLCCRFGIYPRT
tara:strand:- start:844 stop:1689 length:846 start_codon:yes stop_codon:yes gene_type:complete